MATGHIRQRYGHYYYSFEVGKDKGKRHRVERYGGETKKEAETALRQALQEYENGGVTVELTNMSVAEFFNYWFENYVVKNLKQNTQINYLNIINKYITPRIGLYKMKSIGPASLQQFMNDVSELGLSKHSVEIIQTVLRKGFKMAVFPYQLLKENPATYVQMPKYHEDVRKTREKLKIISMDQYKQILDITPESSSFYIPLQIAFNTGLRRGEVCGLEWSTVNFSEHTIEVNQAMQQEPAGNYSITTPKSAASYRTILVGQSLIDILKKHRKQQMTNKLRYGKFYVDSNFVCTKENGEPVTPNSIKFSSHQIQEKLGFPFNFHSLRHTHATMLLENGANIKEIQARLGHSRIATTMDTYSHVTRKMKQETVDIFEKMMRDSQ